MNWRDYGDMPKEAFTAELRRMGSPMLAEADAISSAVTGYSRLFLAMAYHETKLGTLFTVDGFDARYKNPVALMDAAGYVWFRTWEAAAEEWMARLVRMAEGYKGGVYARTTTLEDLIHVYAPASAGNDEQRYVAVVKERLAAYGWSEGPMAEFTEYPVLVSQRTGQTIMVASPVPIVQKIIPISAARPGTALVDPRFWVQHETGNPSVGANAEMHYRFLMGQLGVQTSFHFATDSGQIIQLVPLLEVTWQAADGGGPGNMSSWSNEGCINADGDEGLMRRNCEWLAAGVLVGMAGIGYGGVATADDVRRHWDFNFDNAPAARHHCPDHMMSEGYWPTFVANVATLLAGDPPEPAYANPEMGILAKLGDHDGTDKTIDGTTFFACDRVVTARRTTRRHRVAAPGAEPIGPDITKGDQAPVLYWFKNQNKGTAWFLTRWGTRLRASHFTPYVTFTDLSTG